MFLLAVTGVVLLVRAGLRSDEPAAKTPTTPAIAQTKPSTPKTPVASVPKQYYMIQSGDTLDAIALHFGTSTDALLELNPGIEPTALRPGERVRVK